MAVAGCASEPKSGSWQTALERGHADRNWFVDRSAGQHADPQRHRDMTARWGDGELGDLEQMTSTLVGGGRSKGEERTVSRGKLDPLGAAIGPLVDRPRMHGERQRRSLVVRERAMTSRGNCRLSTQVASGGAPIGQRDDDEWLRHHRSRGDHVSGQVGDAAPWGPANAPGCRVLLCAWSSRRGRARGQRLPCRCVGRCW
jgi:hypothetical protein